MPCNECSAIAPQRFSIGPHMQLPLHWGSNGERHALLTLTEVLPWLMTASVLSEFRSLCARVYNNVKQEVCQTSSGFARCLVCLRGTARAGVHARLSSGLHTTQHAIFCYAHVLCLGLRVRHCTCCNVCKYRSKQPYWLVRKCCACTLSVWYSTCGIDCGYVFISISVVRAVLCLAPW